MVEEAGGQDGVSTVLCTPCAPCGHAHSEHMVKPLSFTSFPGSPFCHVKNLSVLKFACSLNQNAERERAASV